MQNFHKFCFKNTKCTGLKVLCLCKFCRPCKSFSRFIGPWRLVQVFKMKKCWFLKNNCFPYPQSIQSVYHIRAFGACRSRDSSTFLLHRILYCFADRHQRCRPLDSRFCPCRLLLFPLGSLCIQEDIYLQSVLLFHFPPFCNNLTKTKSLRTTPVVFASNFMSELPIDTFRKGPASKGG